MNRRRRILLYIIGSTTFAASALVLTMGRNSPDPWLSQVLPNLALGLAGMGGGWLGYQLGMTFGFANGARLRAEDQVREQAEHMVVMAALALANSLLRQGGDVGPYTAEEQLLIDAVREAAVHVVPQDHDPEPAP